MRLTVTPKGGKPFDLWVLFRLATRYTLVLDGAVKVLRDR
jgi:hypothetical protein